MLLNASRLLSEGVKFYSLFKIKYVVQSFSFGPAMATFVPRFYETEQKKCTVDTNGVNFRPW